MSAVRQELATPHINLRSQAPPSIVSLFKIGIGPSSSHTMGPMTAAAEFAESLQPVRDKIRRFSATVFGSLAWTGKGHGTDRAIALGFEGCRPENLDPANAEKKFQEILSGKKLQILDGHLIDFDFFRDIRFDFDTVMDRHPNAMSFAAFDDTNSCIAHETWFSIGGGFVEKRGAGKSEAPQIPQNVPLPYSTSEELLAIGLRHQLRISEIVLRNEGHSRPRDSTLGQIDRLSAAMFDCIERGLSTNGQLPGTLRVQRRAKYLFDKVQNSAKRDNMSPLDAMGYVSAFAIAVNEENAAGGRVVTAPTNGAAGVFPAVLRFYRDFWTGASRTGIHDFFLAATAIGGLIKANASISGAEVGCQGEVGSAAAMAAAGLTAAAGGTNEQVEQAAEIALEHHLGMTCDPVAGLVQIPCIERNAFGAVKAINAAKLSLLGDGIHRVSLDQVIETMRQTGADMQSKYRETSRGGLAVNVPEC